MPERDLAGRPSVSAQSTTTVRRQTLCLHSQAVQTPPAIHTRHPQKKLLRPGRVIAVAAALTDIPVAAVAAIT